MLMRPTPTSQSSRQSPCPMLGRNDEQCLFIVNVLQNYTIGPTETETAACLRAVKRDKFSTRQVQYAHNSRPDIQLWTPAWIQGAEPGKMNTSNTCTNVWDIKAASVPKHLSLCKSSAKHFSNQPLHKPKGPVNPL